jgi:hypothetical protein
MEGTKIGLQNRNREVVQELSEADAGEPIEGWGINF